MNWRLALDFIAKVVIVMVITFGFLLLAAVALAVATGH